MIKMSVMKMMTKYLLPKNICEGASNHKDDDDDGDNGDDDHDDSGVDADGDDGNVGDDDVPAP